MPTPTPPTAIPWLPFDPTEKEWEYIKKECHIKNRRTCQFANLLKVVARRIMILDPKREILLKSISVYEDGFYYWTERIAGLNHRFRIYFNQRAQRYINRFDSTGKTALLTRVNPFVKNSLEYLGVVAPVNESSRRDASKKSKTYRMKKKAGLLKSNARTNKRGPQPLVSYAELKKKVA